MVHELRNPLGAAKSIVSQLIEEEDDPGKIKSLWDLDKQIERLRDHSADRITSQWRNSGFTNRGIRK